VSWLVVTPAFNEAGRLPAQAVSLVAQTHSLIGLWVVVDDGSHDGTATCVDWGALPFPALLVHRQNSGGLAAGSELLAFREGVQRGLELLPDATRIMKLDADLMLAPDYFSRLSRVDRKDVGLLGGRVSGPGELSLSHHLAGGVCAYTPPAYAMAVALPVALGWDVLDQVAVRRAGLLVHIDGNAVATTSRVTGGSRGLLRGRYRKGIASRWSGYHPAYLAIQVLVHLVRAPFLAGGLALLWGYVSAGPGPFDPELKAFHRREQRARLVQLARHPISGLRGLKG
jgi:dolichol-phosphate mannosyltransferase